MASLQAIAPSTMAPAVAPCFSAPAPLRRARTHTHALRRHSPAACAGKPAPRVPAVLRKAAAAAAATAVLASALPQLPAHALGLAPTPMNPYAKRRAEKAYAEYARALEGRMESVFPVEDVRKLVNQHSAELGVGFRVAGLSAFIAATISTFVVHPLDSVKTRLQAGGGGRGELFADLYKGVFGNILKEAPNAAIYLAVYEAIKTFLLNSPATSLFRDLPLVTFMLAGALGDAVGSVVRVPAEVTNKRMQLGLSESLPAAFRDVVFTRVGQSALRTAWVATLWRDMPYGGLQIMLYEAGKLFLHAHAAAFPPALASGMGGDVLVGAVVAAIAAFVTTPADVLVTRIALASSLDGPAPSIAAHVRAVVAESGPLGLFSGALQRSLIYMAMGGMFFSLYELSTTVASNPHTAELALQHAQHAAAGAAAACAASVGHFAANPFNAVNYAIVEQFPYIISFFLLHS